MEKIDVKPQKTLVSTVQGNSLEEVGFQFKNEKLVSIEDGESFKFDVFDDAQKNQKRYETIGELVDQKIYELLESRCRLTRVTVPVDAKNGEPTSFIFISKNIQKAKALLLIIHGMGVVRAGQWSRKLIMNESLTVGSQIEYIERAQAADYAVIVTNTNLNSIETNRKTRRRSTQKIRGSGTAEEHGRYVWKQFVRPNPIEKILIVGHSYGGAVILEMASTFRKEFEERVVAVALTDSPILFYGHDVKKNLMKILKKVTTNWITSSEPVDTELGEDRFCLLRSAGHQLHEWTSHTAIDCVFKYFSEKLE